MAVNSVDSPERCLCPVSLWAYLCPGTSRDIWLFPRRTPLAIFSWQTHHTVSSLMWGSTGLWWFQSHPSRLQDNDDASIGNSEHNKQDLKQWSVGVKSQNSKERSVSLWRLFSNISRFLLWVQKQLNPALSTNLRQRERSFSWTVWVKICKINEIMW